MMKSSNSRLTSSGYIRSIDGKNRYVDPSTGEIISRTTAYRRTQAASQGESQQEERSTRKGDVFHGKVVSTTSATNNEYKGKVYRNRATANYYRTLDRFIEKQNGKEATKDFTPLTRQTAARSFEFKLISRAYKAKGANRKKLDRNRALVELGILDEEDYDMSPESGYEQ